MVALCVASIIILHLHVASSNTTTHIAKENFLKPENYNYFVLDQDIDKDGSFLQKIISKC